MRSLAGLYFGALIILGAPAVMADDDESEVAAEVDVDVEVREETRCFPAEGIIGFMTRFDGLDETKTDTLHAVFAANINIEDEGGFPDRIYIKSGDQETDMPLDDEGLIQGFTPIIKAAPEGTEICIDDKARAGTPVDQPGATFSLPLSIRMKNESGTYDMAELKDALKDGKSFYKKMVGGAMALLVPKMTHLIVTYEEKETPLNLAVFNGDELIESPVAEVFNGGHVIRYKDLKKAGATRVEISGGEHRILPAPSIKTMEKFGFGGE